MNALISRLVSYKRGIAWCLGGLVALWALAWVAVPPLLKGQIEARGSEALGRRLSIGAIDFKPWSLELTVTDLAIATADGKASQFKVARVYVDAEMQSLLRLAPVVDAITIDAPQVRVVHQGEGHYDFDDIVARLNKPSDTPPSAPLRFALHNLTLNAGEADFIDQSAGADRKHTLRKLNVAVPFLSNLNSQRDVLVTPRLAFELNGSAFDTAAEGTPFDPAHKGEASIKISKFDVAPYLSYLPAGLPMQLKAAVLDTDLRIAFAQQPKVAVTVGGSATLSGLALADSSGKGWLDVESIHTVLADVRPLEQVVKLESLEIVAPRAQIARNRDGQINIAPKTIAAREESTGSTGQKDSKSTGAKPAANPPASPAVSPWQVGLAHFALHGGAVQWTDDSMAPAAPTARLAVADLELQAHAIAWPFAEVPASLEGSMAVPMQASGSKVVKPAKTAQFAFNGKGTDAAGSVHATLGDLGLGLAAPYAAQYLVPQVAGVLDGEFDAQWKDGAVQLTVQRVALRDVALLEDKAKGAEGAFASVAALPKFKQLEVIDTQVDLAKQTARVGKVTLRAPQVAVARDEQGHWMFERWLKAATASAAAPVTEAPPTAKPASSWQVAVAEVNLEDGTVALDDRLPAKPVTATLSALKVQAKTLTLDGKKPAPLTVSARIKAGQTEPGTITYNGTVMWSPVVAQGTLTALQIPAHAFAPYVADKLNIELLRADASLKGTVRYAATAAGPEVQLRVDAALEDFRSNSVQTTGAQGLPVGEELLSWKSLNVPGIALDMVPTKAMQVRVREAALTDFYARVVVSPQGRLNLQDLVKSDAAAAAPTAPKVSPTAATPDPVISIGPVSLVNGKVLFSDRFIRPNYSADLTELTGKLSQFSSQAVDGVAQLADLELRGRAEGSAALEITGKVNPLANPLALDINGVVRDLELPPLSPYAIKYAGYGIERGKLSMVVNYLIKPDGQLTANNSIVLNQLSFGEKVEGAPNSLPVKLAVSLLADRNGVIDLNLPISGSINDPQFSVGPVIWKVITNLIAKALTAPFSLLANAFGGGDELSNVAFAPGSSALSAPAKQGLDKVAKALIDRTGLKLTVQGIASLEGERDALKRERLTGLVMAEKRRRAAAAGQGTTVVAGVAEAEYPVLLKEVYKRSDITKPRNLVGMAKDLPQGEMEALLLANIGVNDDAMRELALNRGVAVRDYLAAQKVESERLFLGAVKTVAPEGEWKPRAELNLTSR